MFCCWKRIRVIDLKVAVIDLKVKVNKTKNQSNRFFECTPWLNSLYPILLFTLLWLSTDKKDCSILSCCLLIWLKVWKKRMNEWCSVWKKDEEWHFCILQVFVEGLSIHVCTEICLWFFIFEIHALACQAGWWAQHGPLFKNEVSKTNHYMLLRGNSVQGFVLKVIYANPIMQHVSSNTEISE